MQMKTLGRLGEDTVQMAKGCFTLKDLGSKEVWRKKPIDGKSEKDTRRKYKG